MPTQLDTFQKARELNLDPNWYGTLAEIGAGQETTQWLFYVGGAAGTIAKSMSAYDMTFSDAIYGETERYVSRQRLTQMLDHEYHLLMERLGEDGDGRRFFVFANTVAARSYSNPGPGRGWIGVRFQSTPGSAPSDMVIHVRLHDLENFQQQEALGILGINLLYAVYALHDAPTDAIPTLMDHLDRNRAEVDMIDLQGPAAEGVDNRLLALELVSRGLTDAAMFTADGRNVELADRFHDRRILVQRGTFRPIIRPVVDMVERAEREFTEPGADPPVVVSEMNLQTLRLDVEADRADLLARLEVLQALDRDVLISSFREHYHLVELLCQYTREPVAVVLGAPTLRLIFDPAYYTDLSGGILEGVARLFRDDVVCYVYPFRDPRSGERVKVDDLDLGTYRHIYAYLQETRRLRPLEPASDRGLDVFPDDVLAMIGKDDSRWREYVPEVAAKAIERAELFGYRSKGEARAENG